MRCLFVFSVVSAGVVFAGQGGAEAATRGTESVSLEFHLVKGEPIAVFEWNYVGAKLKQGKGSARIQKAVKVPVLIVGVKSDTGTVMVHTEDWTRPLDSKVYDSLLCGTADKLYLEVKDKGGAEHKVVFPAKAINVKTTPLLPTLVKKYCSSPTRP
jgi:hypothetical protein